MKIIPLREFLNTDEEIHSFVVGWSEAINLIFAAQEKPESVKKMLAGEWHYYKFGLALGVFTWLGIILGVIKFLGG